MGKNLLLQSSLLTGVALGCVLVSSGQALAQAVSDENAQSASDGGIAEIVVTAQKRQENMQKVPISITAIGGEALIARGLTSVVQLEGAVPGLQFQQQAGIMLPFLRGVGNSSNTLGNESSVAVYADGVYFARLPSAMFELNNVAQVEVLKGPQGTLFGRNSTGGVINIITKNPSHDTMIKGSLGYGRFDAVSGNAYATTGLSENVAMDLSVAGQTDDGFGRNLTTGGRYGYQDSVFVRSNLLFEPSVSTKIKLTGFYSWSRQSGQKVPFPGTKSAALSAPAVVFTPEQIGFYNSISDTPEYNRFTNWGVSLRVDQDLSFARLASISAYSQLNEFDSFDGDHTSRPDFAVPIHGQLNLFTQELQISSLPGSPLTWMIGAFYYNNHSSYDSVHFLAPLLFGPSGLDAPAQQKATSIAGFAQATYEILPRFKVTGGLRYTSDKTSASGAFYSLATNPPTFLPGFAPPPGSEKVNKLTFKASADYQVTDRALIYASFSRGFKSGNFNLLTYNSDVPTKPEGLDAYEIGFKSDLFDGHLRLNGAAFYYDITNPQVQLVQNTTVFYTNAGSSRVKGAEFEAQAALFSGFTARFNAAYLDAKYRKYDNAPTSRPDLVNGGSIPLPDINATGNYTPHAAKWTFGIGSDYAIETGKGTLTLTADYYHNSGYYYEPDNLLYQPAYDLVSAQIKFAPTENLALRLWGKNLTDARYSASGSTQLGNAGYQTTPGAPRTYGVAVDFKF